MDKDEPISIDVLRSLVGGAGRSQHLPFSDFTIAHADQSLVMTVTADPDQLRKLVDAQAVDQPDAAKALDILRNHLDHDAGAASILQSLHKMVQNGPTSVDVLGSLTEISNQFGARADTEDQLVSMESPLSSLQFKFPSAS